MKKVAPGFFKDVIEKLMLTFVRYCFYLNIPSQFTNLRYIFILESFNTNISDQHFYYTITFVNSKNINVTP